MRGKNDGASEARWGTSLGLTLPKFVTKMKQFSPFPFPLLFFPRRENRWERKRDKGRGEEG
jgi:hypothetical protein